MYYILDIKHVLLFNINNNNNNNNNKILIIINIFEINKSKIKI